MATSERATRERAGVPAVSTAAVSKYDYGREDHVATGDSGFCRAPAGARTRPGAAHLRHPYPLRVAGRKARAAAAQFHAARPVRDCGAGTGGDRPLRRAGLCSRATATRDWSADGLGGATT